MEGEDKLIIAIDGYSSCGKSTLAKAVAKNTGLHYLDSGAMYRAVTYYFIQNNIPVPVNGIYNSDEINKTLDAIHISFKPGHATSLPVYLNDVNVEKLIRGMDVSEMVSDVSAIKEVRTRMVKLQQQIGKQGGIVMDGRDIGTAVFPYADLKIFMTADPYVRAQRRMKELHESGLDVSFEKVLKNLEARDKIDTTRKISPLVTAADAIVLDNTHMNRQQQLDFIINEIEKVKEIKLNKKSIGV